MPAGDEELPSTPKRSPLRSEMTKDDLVER